MWLWCYPGFSVAFCKRTGRISAESSGALRRGLALALEEGPIDRLSRENALDVGPNRIVILANTGKARCQRSLAGPLLFPPNRAVRTRQFAEYLAVAGGFRVMTLPLQNRAAQEKQTGKVERGEDRQARGLRQRSEPQQWFGALPSARLFVSPGQQHG